MKAIINLSIACACLWVCCTGCMSNMKVKVDVINRTKLITSSEVALIELMYISDIEENRLLSGYYADQCNMFKAESNEIIDSLVQYNNIALQVKDILKKSASNDIDSIYNIVFIPKIESALIVLKTKIVNDEKVPYDERYSLIRQAKSDLYIAHQKLNEALIYWADFGIINQVKIKVKDIQSVISSNRSGISDIEVFHSGLYNDPLNSLIVQSPDDWWKNMYNKTVAKNFLGNSDVAIVMETPGNFFIKGVRMDAENVTAALSKTFNLSVQMLAKINGLPINQQQTAKEDTNSATVISEKLKEFEEKQLLELNGKITDIALVGMLDALISTKDSLDGTNYKSSLAQLKKIYHVHKEQINALNKND